MKLDLTHLDLDTFVTRPVDIAGEVCTLIFPKHIGAKWNRRNLHFRSSIWNENGDLISASFPKFFNWGEQEEMSPPPKNLRGSIAMEKLDGSTLIVSKYKGELIVRTRGTADATVLDNGGEIAELMEKYPAAFDNDLLNSEKYSYIYEWESPVNRIVVRHDSVDIKLIAVISHLDYYLIPQDTLNVTAENIGVQRPRTYDFDSPEQLLTAVKDFKGVEGVCVYSNNGQTIHKVKGAEYLILHRMRSELSSFDKVMDLYFTLNQPTYNDFYNYVCNTLDFEIAEDIRGDISRICDVRREVEMIIDGFKKCVDEIKELPTRKAQANVIKQKYSVTNRASMVFTLLDGKPLKQDQIKKLFYQKLK
jgi:hypothetical protein